MKKIPLIPNGFALVDNEHYEELSMFKWYAAKRCNTYYAARYVYGARKTRIILMHRQILKLTDKNVCCDHKDGNGLNNQSSNIRECSRMQNTQNRCISSNNRSGYKGVYFDGTNNKWRAEIIVNKKKISLGRHKNIIDASNAYESAARHHFGEFYRPPE